MAQGVYEIHVKYFLEYFFIFFKTVPISQQVSIIPLRDETD